MFVDIISTAPVWDTETCCNPPLSDQRKLSNRWRPRCFCDANLSLRMQMRLERVLLRNAAAGHNLTTHKALLRDKQLKLCCESSDTNTHNHCIHCSRGFTWLISLCRKRITGTGSDGTHPRVRDAGNMFNSSSSVSQNLRQDLKCVFFNSSYFLKCKTETLVLIQIHHCNSLSFTLIWEETRLILICRIYWSAGPEPSEFMGNRGA